MKSVTGYSWESLDLDYKRGELVANEYETTPQIGALALSYGEDLESIFNPKMRDLMPDPSHLLDMDLGVEKTYESIIAGKKVAIFGDYDVDGACATAIIYRFLKSIGCDVCFYIPDRIKEGYGPNINALLKLKSEGVGLVITVDCGTVAFEPLKEAAANNLDVIVIDHHQGLEQKPDSVAVINPNRYDETTDLTYLCGGGVAFLFCVALNRLLKTKGYNPMNLMDLVPLVALSTICDVMELRGLNRAFVKTGIEVAKRGTIPGITYLNNLSGGPLDETAFGFQIGPKINAGGRIGNSLYGVQLLSFDDMKSVREVAEELANLNERRKDMENEALDEIMNSDLDSEKSLVICGSESYHQGIIGILAGRIKDRFDKPCIVMEYRDGVAKASARSVDGIDIGEIISRGVAKGVLKYGGGHEKAGGFSADLGKIDEIKAFFEQEVELAKDSDIEKVRNYHCILSPDLSVELAEEIAKMSPFGNGFLRPTFCIEGLMLSRISFMKDIHMRVTLKSMCGKYLNFPVFNYERSQIGVFFYERMRSKIRVDILFSISVSEWMGQKRPDISIIDVMES